MKLKHSNKALQQMKKQGKIKPRHFDKNKTRRFYVSIDHRNNMLCEINYISK